MTPLDCNELVELVTAYLDGALDTSHEQQVEEHLTGCDGCSAYLAQIEFTIARLPTTAPESFDEARRQQLLEAFRGRPSESE